MSENHDQLKVTLFVIAKLSHYTQNFSGEANKGCIPPSIFSLLNTAFSLTLI